MLKNQSDNIQYKTTKTIREIKTKDFSYCYKEPPAKKLQNNEHKRR